jgi:hypothetical protein
MDGPAEYDIGRIAPDVVPNEIAVPGNRRDHSDGDEEEELVQVEPGAERVVEDGEEDGGRDRVGEMPAIWTATVSMAINM